MGRVRVGAKLLGGANREHPTFAWNIWALTALKVSVSPIRSLSVLVIIGLVPMQVRYSDSNPIEVEIVGTHAEWKMFAERVVCDGAKVSCDLIENPAPYSRSAGEIHVCHLDQHQLTVDVDVQWNALVIAGKPADCSKLAMVADGFAEFTPGQHFHVDYQGDDYFISKYSAATVFVMDSG